jgi:hypothetical protein
LGSESVQTPRKLSSSCEVWTHILGFISLTLVQYAMLRAKSALNSHCCVLIDVSSSGAPHGCKCHCTSTFSRRWAFCSSSKLSHSWKFAPTSMSFSASCLCSGLRRGLLNNHDAAPRLQGTHTGLDGRSIHGGGGGGGGGGERGGIARKRDLLERG